jgi:BrnA antitoxin of type II toxin-antitoxin system
MKSEYDFSKGKRGAVIPQTGKTRISIFIDNAVLDEFRARAERAGIGYQTMMNDALRHFVSRDEQPITETALVRVLRQELPEYLRRLTSRSPHSSRPPTIADDGNAQGVKIRRSRDRS